ncbi:6,7-dimethyl-8-ribityllumazine synthase [Pseudarthrobacter oxydans]|uniref:6,7-dimethyl-8-ribityllumazine synthase n=1 Tax=Pseudarthrobacter oxydans TaxID=1671 RepID=UPI00380A123D
MKNSGPTREEIHRDTRIAVISGVWHGRIADGLLAGATSALEDSGCQFEIFHVSSSFDLPLIAQAALEGTWDGAVVLGVIMKGESSHFERLSEVVTKGLGEVTLQTRKPIGFGVLMVNTEKEGEERAGLSDSKEDRGREAAEWTLASTALLRQLRSHSSRT